MKQNKFTKHFLILGVFLLLIILNGCQIEDVEIQNKAKNSSIISKNFALTDLENSKSNFKLLESVNKVRSLRPSLENKVEYNALYDFYINKEKGKYIETANAKSYTFPISRLISDGKLENIVFTLNTEGNYDVAILKYDITNKELLSPNYNGQAKPIEYKKLFKTATVFNRGEDPIANPDPGGYICIMMCFNNGHGGAGGAHTAGQNCTNPNFLYTDTIYVGNGSSTGNNSNGNYSNDQNVTTPVGGDSLSNPYTANFDFSAYSNGPVYDDQNYINAMKSENFYQQLGHDERLWASQNTSAYFQIIFYQIANNWSNASCEFSRDLMNLAMLEPNQQDVNSLINLTLKLEQNSNNLFNDVFIQSLDPYIDLDLANDPDPVPKYCMIGVKTFLNYKNLRRINPEWSRAKCMWNATKEIIHISLDAFGLIPVGGEIADLANGVLYTIEGDGLNATLSYASAVPIVGWAAAGTKFGLKVVTTTSGVTKLVWKVAANGLIEFGSRGQLRKVLGLAVGNANQAHHIIPWAKSTNVVIQKAAKSGSAFHMNQALMEYL